MAGFLADTSILVATVSSWHEYHIPALSSIESRMKKRIPFFIAGHTLIETYSVLTRLPDPHRIDPKTASHLIFQNFKNARTITLNARKVWDLISKFAERSLGGALIYDAVILEAARIADVEELLTFNERDFRRINSTNRPRLVVPH